MENNVILASRPAIDTFAYGRIMYIRVLGPLEVVADGRLLTLGGLKQRTVLAVLAANVGTTVSPERLIEATWGDEPPDGARHSLHTYISALRGELGDVLVRESQGYRLTVDREAIDAFWFEDEVYATKALHDDEAVADRLSAALAVWRGHPYADVDGGSELRPEVSRLDDLRMVALEARIDADLALGRHREVIGELDALTVEYPLRERFRAQQMIALFRAGRQSEALRAYQKTRTYLGGELGIDPSPDLRDLEQRILDQDDSLLLETATSILRRAVLVAAIDASDGLADIAPAQRRELVDEYGAAFDSAVAEAGGSIFARRGTATYAAFESVVAAVAAAETAQRRVAATGVEGPGLRIAVDVGDVEAGGDGEVSGPPIARSASLVATAWGGQALLSSETQVELAQSQEAGWQIKALGPHPIPGLDEQAPVYQLVVPDLPNDFPDPRTDRTPPGLPLELKGLPGYELREVVGRGSFGVVHRGYQASVGREVAIKVIRPDLANEPEFIRRFEVEAQLVARLEHPHIVPVYDYWRDPEGAYLVMRWIRGDSLATRLREGDPFSLDEAVDLVAQLAPALDVAHRAGVVHRDIKPSNVLVDEHGNAYLSDFGIAFDVVGEGTPEQAPPDVHTDIAGLGLLLRDALGGGASGQVAVVLETATASDVRLRYPSVADLVGAWEEAIGAAGMAEAPVTFTPTRNPYKGLAAFEEVDAPDFHGRAEAIDTLAAAVDSNRLVAVVGPSGIGKSSLVKAGLIPALRAGAAPGSESWLITDMVPGPYPFEELASALLRIGDRYPTGLDEELRSDRRGLVRVAGRLLPPGSEALLVIDQFEELFTHVVDPGDADRFLEGLTELIGDPDARVRVVVTIRADFFDRPLRHPEFGDLLRTATVPIAAPTGDDLAEIVQRPAENLGVGFEPGLVDRIVGDVAGQPAALPLLEFSLTELFAGRTSDVISLAAYDDGGGVLGALAHRAEEVYYGLDRDSREATRQIMLRLVSISEASDATRRRVRRSELDHLDVPSETIETVVARFGAARLLTFDRDQTTRGPTVEVAHEAIFTEWERLADWIEGHREDLILSRRLSTAVADWEEADEDPTYLPTGGRLAQFETHAEATDLALTSTERRYLAESREAEDARIATRRRRRRLITAGFGVAAVVALALAVAALIARNDSAESADLARSRELSAAAIANLDRDPELSLLLALEASAGAESTIGSASALREALASHRAILTYTYPADRNFQNLRGDISPDGQLLAVSGEGDGFVQVVDIDTGAIEWEIDLGQDFRADQPFFIDGGAELVVPTFLVGDAGSTDEPAGLWVFDSVAGSVLRKHEIGECGALSAGFYHASDEVAYARLPACGADLDARLPETEPMFRIDLATGEASVLPGAEGVPFSVNASSDESRVVVSADARFERPMTVIDGATGEVVFTEPDTSVGEVADISPDGQRILYDGNAGREEVLDLATNTVVSLYHGHEGLWNAWFADDGKTVYSSGPDGTFQLWDPETGETLLTVPYGEPAFWSAVTPDLSRAAVFSAGDTVKVFELEADVDPTVAAFSPDECDQGNGFRSLDAHGDVASLGVICGHEEQFVRPYIFDPQAPSFGDFVPSDGDGMAISSDSTRFAVQPIEDGLSSVVAVFDVDTGTRLRDMEGLCGKDWFGVPDASCNEYPELPYPDLAGSLHFSPDGEQLAMAGWTTGSVTVWDVGSGSRLANWVPGLRVQGIAFSPDGSLLLVGSTQDLTLYSTDTWDAVTGRDWRGESGAAPSDIPHFNSDGTLIVAAAHPLEGDSDVVVLDAETLETTMVIPRAHFGAVEALDLSSDDEMVATGGSDGFVRVWSLRTGALLDEIPVSQDGVRNVAFIDDDRKLMVTGTWSPLKIVTIDRSELVDLARPRVTRGFTQSECDQYQIDPCPTLEEIRTG